MVFIQITSKHDMSSYKSAMHCEKTRARSQKTTPPFTKELLSLCPRVNANMLCSMWEGLFGLLEQLFLRHFNAPFCKVYFNLEYRVCLWMHVIPSLITNWLLNGKWDWLLTMGILHTPHLRGEINNCNISMFQLLQSYVQNILKSSYLNRKRFHTQIGSHFLN
jgi:hypothetical protein